MGGGGGGSVRQAGGGGVSGWVIRIIFDPNTRQWGGGGGFSGVVIRGSLWIILGPFRTILLIAL